VVDADGALVGLIAENRSGNDGFVVPASDLKRLVDSLVATGTPKRPWLGVSTRPGAGQGLVVLGVEPGSPADRAGWKADDLLVSLAGTALKEPGDFARALAQLVPGTESVARLVRDGEVVDRPITPEGR
jgi:S1-C subfamily serine protease